MYVQDVVEDLRKESPKMLGNLFMIAEHVIGVFLLADLLSHNTMTLFFGLITFHLMYLS